MWFQIKFKILVYIMSYKFQNYKIYKDLGEKSVKSFIVKDIYFNFFKILFLSVYKI